MRRLPLAIVVVLFLAGVCLAAGWMTSATAANFTGTDNDWVGYTLVTRITAAQLSNIGGTQVRITIRGGTVQGAQIANLYIGMGTGTGDDMSFESTPTQVLFGGMSGVLAAANTDAVSDATTFTILGGGKNLLLASYFDSGSNDDAGKPTSPTTGWQSNYNFGSKAADIDKSTGWTDQGTNVLIKTVESFIPGVPRGLLTLGVG